MGKKIEEEEARENLRLALQIRKEKVKEVCEERSEKLLEDEDS